jgi:5'-nucleotidase
MKKPFILITNDDGIHAPGIMQLYKALKDHADCVIYAPFWEKSGSGLSTTLTKPLQIQNIPWDKNTPAYRINGTPTDCIKLALSVLLNRKPDLIVSGINQGSNAGRTVLYSGTIGAVIEGIHKNIPGIAFSCADLKNPDYSKTEKYIYPIIEYLLNHPLDQANFHSLYRQYQFSYIVDKN